jgi:SAM-dependent methyltransferase
MRKHLELEFHQRRIRCTVALVALAQTKLAPVSRILDLGCGEGHITDAIHQAAPGAEVSGLDYSISAINYASRHFPHLDFAVGNAYQSPYASGYFDLVVCNNLWEHVPDPLNLLKEVSRVSRDGAGVIISTPSRYRLDNLLRLLRGYPIQFLSEHHVTEYSVGQVKEQLRYGGYEALKTYTEPIGRPPLKVRVFRKFVSLALRWIKSHHELEGTVFFLARKDRNFSSPVSKAQAPTAPHLLRL